MLCCVTLQGQTFSRFLEEAATTEEELSQMETEQAETKRGETAWSTSCLVSCYSYLWVFSAVLPDG